jgi:hypothetical protein
MGISTYVGLSHDVHPFDDASLVLARLQRALPEALAVREYFRSVGDGANDKEAWEGQFGEYRGPGGLWMEIQPNIAIVSPSSRWSGFMTIKPLRTVYLSAFRSIARALNSPTMVVCGEDNWPGVDQDAFLDDVIAALTAEFGPPHTSLDTIEDPEPEDVEWWKQPAWYLGAPPRSIELMVENTVITEPAWYLDRVMPD